MPTMRGARHRASSRLTCWRVTRQGAELGSDIYFVGRPIVAVEPKSLLSIGHRSMLISRADATALGVNHPVVLRTLRSGALLSIGDHVGISGGSVIAASRVTIGAGSLLGANVTVMDTDFHPIDSLERFRSPLPEPVEEDAVEIGRNVFIGTGAIILKGSRLGDNCVVGAGSVVKGRFPANTVVAGNPARKVRQVDIQSVRG